MTAKQMRVSVPLALTVDTEAFQLEYGDCLDSRELRHEIRAYVVSLVEGYMAERGLLVTDA